MVIGSRDISSTEHVTADYMFNYTYFITFQRTGEPVQSKSIKHDTADYSV